ncbi:MAG: PilZ domain-containing protein [Elusimicrobiota bacterium]
MNAKRKHNRKETLFVLNIVDLNNPHATARAAVIDISMGGAAFECVDKRFEEGDSVELRFVFSESKVYVFSGTVKRVHQREDGTFFHGVQFRDLGLIDKIKLFILIHKIGE